jgi:hypothetical protein
MMTKHVISESVTEPQNWTQTSRADTCESYGKGEPTKAELQGPLYRTIGLSRVKHFPALSLITA